MGGAAGGSSGNKTFNLKLKWVALAALGDNPSESGPEGGESVLYDGHGGRRMGPEMRDRRRKGFFFSDALKFSPRGQARAQRSAKVGAPGLVNFITAVAYRFCLNLPAAFT